MSANITTEFVIKSSDNVKIHINSLIIDQCSFFKSLSTENLDSKEIPVKFSSRVLIPFLTNVELENTKLLHDKYRILSKYFGLYSYDKYIKKNREQRQYEAMFGPFGPFDNV